MKKTLILSLAASSLLFAGEFGIELGAQQSKLQADFAYGDSDTRTKVNEDDLGLDDKQTSVKPRLYYKAGNHTIDFDFESLDFSGSTTLTKTINFDNETYNFGDKVDSTLEIDWYRLGYRYKVFGNEKSYFNMGLDLNILDTDVGLKTSTLNNSYSEVIPLPTLVIDGNYAINDRFGVEAKFAGISAGSNGHYTEAFVGLNMRCFLLDDAQWRIGYQAKELEVDVDDFDGELKFKGAFLGLNYKF